MASYPHSAAALMRFKAQDGAFTLTKGQQVTVLGEADDDGDWLKVKDADGAEGTVPSGFLTAIEGEPATAEEAPAKAQEPAPVAPPMQEEQKAVEPLSPPPAQAAPAPAPAAAAAASAAPAASKSPPPPAAKPSGLRDRIAMFNKPTSGAGAGGGAPPAPRPKPPLARKPMPAPAPPVASSLPETTSEAPASQAEKFGSAGMSAADAEESVRAGGSLKDRIRLLQQQQQQAAQQAAQDAAGAGAGEPAAPKPKREWKRPAPPPTEEGAASPPVPMGMRLPTSPPTSTKSSTIPLAPGDEDLTPQSESAMPPPADQAGLPTSGETAEAAGAEGEAPRELTEEEEEAARRKRLAERMAKLGGARMGFGMPPMGAPPPRQAAPPRQASLPATEPDAAEQADEPVARPIPMPGMSQSSATSTGGSDAGSATLSPPAQPARSLSPGATTKSPATVAMPAVPRRTGPPRRKPPAPVRTATDEATPTSGAATSTEAAEGQPSADAPATAVVPTESSRTDAATVQEDEGGAEVLDASSGPAAQSVHEKDTASQGSLGRAAVGGAAAAGVATALGVVGLSAADKEEDDVALPGGAKTAGPKEDTVEAEHQQPSIEEEEARGVEEGVVEPTAAVEDGDEVRGVAIPSVEEDEARQPLTDEEEHDAQALAQETDDTPVDYEQSPETHEEPLTDIDGDGHTAVATSEAKEAPLVSPPPVPAATRPGVAAPTAVEGADTAHTSPPPRRPSNPSPETALHGHDLLTQSASNLAADAPQPTPAEEQAVHPEEDEPEDPEVARRAAIAKRMAAMGGRPLMGGMPVMPPRSQRSLPTPPAAAAAVAPTVDTAAKPSPPRERPKGPRPPSDPSSPAGSRRASAIAQDIEPEPEAAAVDTGVDAAADETDALPTPSEAVDDEPAEVPPPLPSTRPPPRKGSTNVRSSTLEPIDTGVTGPEPTGAEGVPTAGEIEEDEEAARRRRIAERMAKMGGRPMMGGLPPMFAAARPKSPTSPTREDSLPSAPVPPLRGASGPPPTRQQPPVPPPPQTSEDDAGHEHGVLQGGLVDEPEGEEAEEEAAAPPPPPRPSAGHGLTSPSSGRPPVPIGYTAPPKRSSTLGSNIGSPLSPTHTADAESDGVPEEAVSPPPRPARAPPARAAPEEPVSPPLPSSPPPLPSSPPPRSPKARQGSMGGSRMSGSFIAGHSGGQPSLGGGQGGFGADPAQSESLAAGLRLPFKARDLDLASERWWRARPIAPPSSILSRPDVLTHLTGSSSLQQGITQYQYRLVVMHPDFSKTVASVSFQDGDDSESATQMHQEHFPPPQPYSASTLQQLGQAIGQTLAAQAKSKEGDKQFRVPNDDSKAFVRYILSTHEEALPPIGNTYGQIIFSFNRQDVKGAQPETWSTEAIRPGDVIAAYGADFRGKGIGHASMTLGTPNSPHVGIVAESDNKKNKLKAYIVSGGKVEVLSYRLDELRSGSLKVFRVLDRGFLNI